MSIVRPAFKMHGGKRYMAQWILNYFPAKYEKYDFIEPYVGGGSVFFNKNKSPVEVINDKDSGIIQIYRALRDEPAHFIGRLKRIKYCEDTFNRIKNKECKNHIDHAVKEFVIRRMSRGGMKTAFAWSDRKRGGKPGDVNAWETIIKQLPLLSARLRDVFIFNEDALKVIHAFDDENSLLYVDPPYLPETRTSPQIYEYEMSVDDHVILAEKLNKFKGKVILSGYPSQLYRRLYKGWKCHKKQIANHASQVKEKPTKTEMIWVNF